MFDDLDDAPFDLSLRIPPIQSPKPYFANYRPRALEPDAGIEVDGTKTATAKLGSALKSGREKPKDFNQASAKNGGTNVATHSSDHRSSAEARKRQKVGLGGLPGDFVQLPKPVAKAKVEMLSLQPVPVLNELHEPPPSAALFPPITPKTLQDASNVALLPARRSPERVGVSDPASPTSETGGKKKRICLRTRRNWTKEETDDLLQGIGIYGVGKWKKILHHDGFSFHPERTTVDLKDRYRTCRLIEAKALEKACDGGLIGESSMLCKAPSTLPDKRSLEDSKCDSEKSSRRSAPRWTKAEDEALARGYSLYGFRWTAISKDPQLGLHRRTGNQVRDRFRLKFRKQYNAAVPRPLVEDVGADDSLIGTDLFSKLNSALEHTPNESTAMTDGQHLPSDEPGPNEQTPIHSSSASKEVSRSLEDGETDVWREEIIEICKIAGDDERKRSPSPTEDIRHLGILGLLNDEEDDEQMSRLPALKFSYDDYEDNVTLPPLLWEDLANRPIFDLE